MARMAKVVGASRIVANFAKADKRLQKRFRVGLKRAGLKLQALSQDEAPIDTGHMRGSADTRLEGQGWNSDAVVFYTAAYAIYVHELTYLQHRIGKAKFLEDPAKNNREELLKIIKDEMSGLFNGGVL